MTNIYLITNLAVFPNMYYVGKTIDSLEKRLHEHIRMASKENNRLLHEAILEYGKRNFIIELIEVVPEEESSKKEEFYIRKFNSHFRDGAGYNMRYESSIKDKTYHGAAKEIVIRNIDNGDAWNKGISLSEETKQKVSRTKKQRSKLGLYNLYGHKHSEETKKKLSEIAKNRPTPTEETRNKLKEKSSGRICYYNPEEKKRIFLKNVNEVPDGYIKGKGTVWLNNGESSISVDLWEKEEYIRNGYSKGRVVYVGRNS
jgi:group I intron endonuclease